MSIRNAMVSLLLLLAFPIASLAQDASAVVQTLQQGIAKELPPKIRIAAAGSGYTLANADSVARHFGIERYTQELDLKSQSLSEHIVAANADASSVQLPAPEPRTVRADSPWSTQYILWMTPYGFLSGAATGKASIAPETWGGAKYTVVTFTPPRGQAVRGYVNEQNMLERVRTTFEDPARGKVDVEAIYSYWMDFNGYKFPTMIIEKQNDELFRVLVVHKVETGNPGTS